MKPGSPSPLTPASWPQPACTPDKQEGIRAISVHPSQCIWSPSGPSKPSLAIRIRQKRHHPQGNSPPLCPTPWKWWICKQALTFRQILPWLCVGVLFFLPWTMSFPFGPAVHTIVLDPWTTGNSARFLSAEAVRWYAQWDHAHKTSCCSDKSFFYICIYESRTALTSQQANSSVPNTVPFIWR